MMTLMLLDYASVLVFALSGALVASRAQLDIVGFFFIACLTAVGGGTLRDLLLDRNPVFWGPPIVAYLTALDTARFASTLSILMASGVPLLESLRIAGQVMSNLVLRDDSEAVAERVQEGSSLNRALQQSGRFPPMMVHMVASGEASGELETMLARSAANQERELEMTLGTVMSLFEPLMVVFMGGMVLTIVLAILLPIFNLNTMVN